MSPGALRPKARSALRWVFAAEPFGAESEAVRKSPDAGSPAAESDGPDRDAGGVVADEDDHGVGAGGLQHGKLRFWIAIGIVIAATSTAAGAWRAEIFTEYGIQKDALFRQDLSGQQLAERSDEEVAMSQLRQFGAFEGDAFIATQFQSRAAAASGVRGTQLGVQAQNAWMLAALTAVNDFSTVFPSTNSDGTASLDPASGYAAALLSDFTLASFDPSDLHARAQRARSDAVQMSLVAVFFALTVVLLTLAEMELRRPMTDARSRWPAGQALASASVVIWLGAATAFVLLFLDVPNLK